MPPNLEIGLQNLKAIMEAEGQKIVALAQTLAQEWGIKFVGIDASLAPMGDESIAYAMEQQLPGYFGERGTLTVAAGLTRTLPIPRTTAVWIFGINAPCP